MAKKPRGMPWLQRNREPPRPAAAPDEVIRIPGVGSITRHGRTVVWSANRTAEEHEVLTRRLADDNERVTSQIQDHVDTCARLVCRYDPLHLLQRAYLAFFKGIVGKRAEHELDSENAIDLRMLDYVQSLIVSRSPADVFDDLDETAWAALRSHVSDLYDLLLAVWPSTESAERTLGGEYDPALENFRMPLLLEWVSVRGSRYSIHERERAETLLRPHSDRLRALLGVDPAAIADSLHELLRRLTHGMGTATQTILEIHRETFADVNLAEFEETGFSTTEELIRSLVQRTGRAEELAAALRRAYGLDLFDVTELFPRPLLELLSLAPGEDSTFFSDGKYSGWPVRMRPTILRPVLRIEERFYVFDPYATDRLYRAIERAVITIEPDYRQQWNARQKAVSEELPIVLLSAIFAGATVFRDVEYPFREGDSVKWCECDRVLVLDDFLLAIEIKAGRATTTSPLDDLAAHVRNVKDLLLKPTEQADRFVGYLDSAEEVVLYDKAHSEVGRLRRRDIRFRARCAVTLDAIPTLARSFQHLDYVCAGRTVPPVWCLSVDDLYAYRDVLRGSIHAFHFVQQRLRAFEVSQLVSLGEFDHLGAYLKTNDYALLAKIAGCDQVVMEGYRAPLDEFFGIAWETGRLEAPPTQFLPPILNGMIDCLERARPAGFLRAGATILDLDGPSRRALAGMVLQAHSAIGASPGCKLVTQEGEGFSVFVAVRRGEPTSDENVLRDQALAHLLRRNQEEAFLIMCVMSADATVVGATCVELRTGGLGTFDLERLRAIGEAVVDARFAKARTERLKFGRNDLCPCLSGKKYKKCCLNKLRS